MTGSSRTVILGHDPSWGQATRWLLLAVAIGICTFLGYVLNVFAITGGVVFIPDDAALVGLAAAAVVGYRRAGLVVAWLLTVAALLGYRAYHAFPGLSYRSFSEQLAYFLDPEGLVVFAVEGFVLALLPFAGGWLVRLGVERTLGETADSGTGP